MTPKYRFAELQKKGFCFQCLYPGADKNSGKHRDGHCQTDFVCKHSSHNKFSKKKHVLVCEEHSQTNENKQLLEEYKSRCIYLKTKGKFTRIFHRNQIIIPCIKFNTYQQPAPTDNPFNTVS